MAVKIFFENKDTVSRGNSRWEITVRESRIAKARERGKAQSGYTAKIPGVSL